VGTNKRNKKKPPPKRQVPIVRESSCCITVKKIAEGTPSEVARDPRTLSVYLKTATQ
jgi:hypothetical protein